MAILTKKDFKQMNSAQLGEKLSDLRKELMKINTQISTGTTPENPGRVREVKKTIARLITAINIKQREPKEKPKKEESKEEKPKKEKIKEEAKVNG
ncbi:MAG: 50S ribosomal protein L29 [Nanoarchaeota archaeon]|nr:50S ribosomal protein L29 [Nanoarchaeota archaeon]MCG2718144.1 50S ribosomal protein L29 [Nanoarchaeota archaeon]